jgi:UDP-GlcNAc:undecaprenyl-phosphate GlcNAc-1-phosphate transferase
MDGLAAGVGAIAAAFSTVHAVSTGHWSAATVALVLCGVCLGFLRYNFPPAKIFMGDSGSHLIGLSLAILVLWGSVSRSTQLVSVLAVPTLVLAVPIFDTCFVTVQRLLHRQHPFTGGTDHVSHRLAILGLSTRQTVVALYGVSICLGLLSLASAHLKSLAALALWASVLTALLVVGLYLAQVKVYRVDQAARPAGSPSAARMTPLGTMLLHKRRLLEVLADFCILSSAYVFAYLLRFEGVLTGEFQLLIMKSLPIILVVNLAAFAGCGLYRGVWRYLSLSDLVTIVKAVTLGAILSSLTLLYLWRFQGFSRAVLIITWMLTFLGVGGSRVLERLLDEWIHGAIGRGVPAVIIGAGDTGAHVLRSLKYGPKGAYRVLGFLDDDLRKLGDRIHGSPVLGTRAELPRLVENAHVREVLVAITDPPGDLLEFVRACCEPRGVTWKVVTAGVTDAV